MIPARGPDPEFWLSRKLGDLMINHDTNDLLIFYYAGHGQAGRLYGGESPCIFVAVKKSTWDRSPGDVLYLLDCCNAATAGIRPGKELIAASSVEGKAARPDPYSFTAALVQELNHAGYSKDSHYLTVAQLYFKMLEKVHTGELMHTPIHVETMVGPQPRTSIFLAPLLRSGATASESVTPSTYPLSGVNLIPLGCRRTDIRVMLSVRLRDGNARTVQELRNWLITQRAPNIEHPGISFEHAVPSSADSIMVITFIMPVPEWYCLQGSPALTFMAWSQPQLTERSGEDIGNQPSVQQGRPSYGGSENPPPWARPGARQNPPPRADRLVVAVWRIGRYTEDRKVHWDWCYRRFSEDGVDVWAPLCDCTTPGATNA
ncbi:MAG: hypothetical protein L6R35_005210 [Caloplaca aegaea]|nr:MAG: hypothetical protein L6R35_005210 [Caloplaca aegaea]